VPIGNATSRNAGDDAPAVMRKHKARSPNPRKARYRAAPYSRLTVHEKAARERALNLLSDLRRGEGSYSELLSKHHLSSRTARKHLGRDLLGGTRGEPVRASKADRRVRELLFPMSFGDVPARIRGSKDATTLSEFFHDRDQLLRGKLSAEDFAVKWLGVRVAGKELFADAAEIFRMANADELKVEHLYASTGGEQ